MGVRCGKIPDRPGLVVLSFLGARVLAKQTWLGADGAWTSDFSDLRYLGLRECRRRLAFLLFDPARAKRQFRPQDRHADLCHRRDTGRVRVSRREHVVCRPADRTGRGLPPGIFRQPLYPVLGHVSCRSSWFRERNRRHGWCHRRYLRRILGWPRTSVDGQLQSSVPDRQRGLFTGACRDSSSGPTSQAGEDRFSNTSVILEIFRENRDNAPATISIDQGVEVSPWA